MAWTKGRRAAVGGGGFAVRVLGDEVTTAGDARFSGSIPGSEMIDIEEAKRILAALEHDTVRPQDRLDAEQLRRLFKLEEK